MKKTVLFLFAIIIVVSTFAQHYPKDKSKVFSVNNRSYHEKAINYTFTMTNGTYSDLIGATSINNDEIWDDPSFEILLPFSFVINGTSVTNLLYSEGLGGSLSSEILVDSLFEDIWIFGCDIIDRGFALDSSMSPISYLVDGNIGSRIFKIEWKNAGAYNEGEPYNMFINFQLWLYEGSNIIEIHFGPNMINDPFIFYEEETGAYIGLSSFDAVFQSEFNIQLLNGSASAPTLTSTVNTINGTPSNGTIYRFSPISLSVENHTPSNNLIISPNPCMDIIKVLNAGNEETKIIMMDQTGRVVLTTMIHSNQNSIDISSLASGIYFISSEYNGYTSTSKLIKQ